METLSHPNFNAVLHEQLAEKNWRDQPHVFDEVPDPAARMDYLKERIGVGVGFGHAGFLGIGLLKCQVSSHSSLVRIDVAIYFVTTKRFQRAITTKSKKNWGESLTFKKVAHYLLHLKSAIQVPIYVLSIDL